MGLLISTCGIVGSLVYSKTWVQIKDYRIGADCFCAKRAALIYKSKDWLARYQDNVFDRSNMSTVVSVSEHHKNPA